MGSSNRSVHRIYRFYGLDVRQQAVNLYESGYGSSLIGHNLGVDERLVRRWISRYKETGLGGLCGNSHKIMDSSFKDRAVRDVLEKSLSFECVAAR